MVKRQGGGDHPQAATQEPRRLQAGYSEGQGADVPIYSGRAAKALEHGRDQMWEARNEWFVLQAPLSQVLRPEADGAVVMKERM